MQLSTEGFHPAHNMKPIRADIWAEEKGIMFVLELHATSLEAAEDYIRSVYPNITTLCAYHKD
jgi:hypothetical protein